MAQLDATIGNGQTGHLADHNKLHAKANYVFDVSDYGAVGDGVTDDSAAIQAALDAANTNLGGTVLLPSGKAFLHASTLIIYGNTELVGGGAFFDTELRCTVASGYGISMPEPNARIADLDIRRWGGDSTAGIHVNTAGRHVTIQRCRIKDWIVAGDGYGILIDGDSNHFEIHLCQIDNCKTYAIKIEGTSNGGTIRNTNINMQSQTGGGVFINTNVYITNIIGCNFEGNDNGDEGVSIDGVTGVLLYGNYLERWNGGCVVADSGTAALINMQNNTFHANDSASACIILDSDGPNDAVTMINNFFSELGESGYADEAVLPGSTTGLSAFGNRSTGSAETPFDGVAGSAWFGTFPSDLGVT